MSNEARLQGLFARYVEHHVEHGKGLPTEELCRDDPELQESLQRLVRDYHRLDRSLPPLSPLAIGEQVVQPAAVRVTRVDQRHPRRGEDLVLQQRGVQTRRRQIELPRRHYLGTGGADKQGTKEGCGSARHHTTTLSLLVS